MIGLILEGGGAKGAYQIGACRAISELGIEINGVAGTSVGALNGALVVQGELEKAYDMWYNIQPCKIFSVNEDNFISLKNLNISNANIRCIKKKAKKIFEDKGLDIEPLKHMLLDNIDEDKIRNSKKDFGIVTVSLTDFKPMEIFKEDIPRGKMVDYLLASSSLPVFKTQKIGEKEYIDGGFYNNIPIDLLQSKGYKKFIVIRTFAIGREKRINKDNLQITYINPSQKLGKILDFDNKSAREALKLGYFDALRVFKGLKGLKYYIKLSNKDFFFNYLLSLNENVVYSIGNTLGFEGIHYRRMLFEHIVPRIFDLLNLNKESSYEEIMIQLLEVIATKYNVERFKVYTTEEFIYKISESFSLKDESKIPSSISFVSRNGILANLIKDELLEIISFQIFSRLFKDARQ